MTSIDILSIIIFVLFIFIAFLFKSTITNELNGTRISKQQVLLEKKIHLLALELEHKFALEEEKEEIKNNIDAVNQLILSLINNLNS